MSKFSTEVINGKVEVQKMNHVYGNAEEKWVKTTVLYGKADDDYLYSDEASATAATAANRIDKDTLLDLLLKGAVISYGGVYYAPLYFGESSGAVSVTFATTLAASTNLTGTVVTLYSSEHAA